METASEPTQLPLFPLGQVLFPGMPLPLHIFEERYRSMIGHCLQTRSPFGVVLIKDGKEVGAPATPQGVGTTAVIVQSQTLPGGRLNIMTRGQQRFAIDEVIQTLPHLIGTVRLLPDEDGTVSPGTFDAAQAEYAMCIRDMARLGAPVPLESATPLSPVALSYAIVARLSTTVKLPIELRQEWLETATGSARLEAVLPVLRALNKTLAKRLKERAADVGLN